MGQSKGYRLCGSNKEFRKSQWLETTKVSVSHSPYLCSVNFAVSSHACLQVGHYLERCQLLSQRKDPWQILYLLQFGSDALRLLSLHWLKQKAWPYLSSRKQETTVALCDWQKNGKIWWSALMTAMMEQKKKKKRERDLTFIMHLSWTRSFHLSLLNLMSFALFLFPFYRWINWGSVKLSSLPILSSSHLYPILAHILSANPHCIWLKFLVPA